MKIRKILRDLVLEDLRKSDQMEESFFSINEISLDPQNSYTYRKTEYLPDTQAWEFEDRCGNTLVAVYIKAIKEFKIGYKVKGVNTLVFKPEELKDLTNLIYPCPDDKRINTMFRILIEEVVPKYLLNVKPGKLLFNPVSKSRERLVSIILSKVLKIYPQLERNGNYLLNKQ